MKVSAHTSVYAPDPGLWTARLLIFIVFTLNITCAIQFLGQPSVFTPSFNLSGETGIIAIRSIGVLFLMWNVPYVIAILHPKKYFIALVSSVIMQGIGVLGESWIYLQIHSLPFAKSSILRFIWFDAFGLILLMAAFILIQRRRLNG